MFIAAKRDHRRTCTGVEIVHAMMHVVSVKSRHQDVFVPCMDMVNVLTCVGMVNCH